MKKAVLIGAAIIIVLGGAYWYISNNTVSPVSGTNTATTTESTTNLPEPDTLMPVSTSPVSAAAATTSNVGKIMHILLHTSMGDITVVMFPKQAPNTVANFLKLVQEGFYDGTKFHRVIKGFMDQGGDPLTKDDSLKPRWGTGGPGYAFNDEITAENNNGAGTIAMANSGPNTQGSQFFINAVANPSLNKGYTVFGKVTSGMDVVLKINETPTDANDRPLTPVVLISATLLKE